MNNVLSYVIAAVFVILLIIITTPLSLIIFIGQKLDSTEYMTVEEQKHADWSGHW